MVQPLVKTRLPGAVVRRAALAALFVAAAELTGQILSDAAVAAESGRPSAEGRNLALGAKYTLFPAPNYALCTDPGDAIQLTDGKSTTKYFWTQKGTVGWQHAQYALITVDLGRVQPIGGVAFTTAAGRAGVCWPASIEILVSDDGRNYFHVGDLVTLDHKVHGPWPGDYAIRRLSTAALATRGRFVRFMLVPTGPYAFCDEVEVLTGPAGLLSAAHTGEPVTDPRSFFQKGRFHRVIARRWQSDVESLGQAIRSARLPGPQAAVLRERLRKVEADFAREEPVWDPSFRAVMPIGATHARLFAIQAGLWEALGHGPLEVWTPPAWDPLEMFDPLPKSPQPRIEIAMMRGEFRAAAINLANATQGPIRLAGIRWEDQQGAASPIGRCVAWHDVPWTETSLGTTVLAALPEIVDIEVWARTARIEPGLTRQLWLTFHPTDLPAGRYQGILSVATAGAGQPHVARIPVRLRIYPPELPKKPSLLVGGWCYTEGHGSRGITPQNRPAFLRHLQERFVNCPWAGGSVMMQCQFTPGDLGQVTLDTRLLDDWIAQWPEAARYMVFLSAGSSLGGARAGTPQFDRRVAAWISAWVRHLAARNIAPQRLALLIHDEPHEKTDAAPIVAWARAIHAAAPQVIIWEDPTYRDPARAPAALFATATVLCPNRPMWLAGGPAFAEFYRRQQAAGRGLEFYSCSGPVRALDPYSYYRLQAWHCWQLGAAGSSFWSFSDNSGVSCWNEYLAAGGPFSPLFLDPQGVTAGKQMEAIRESVEDYETLAMLRRAIERARAAGRNAAAVRRAETLLAGAADEVLTAPNADKLLWKDPKDRTRADVVRARLLEALSTLE